MIFMDCEVCGNKIYGIERKVIIDGARLVVCSKCITSSTRDSQEHRDQTFFHKSDTTVTKARQRPIVSKQSSITIREDLDVVDNYSILVREARERLELTHDELSRKVGIKVSLLQKIETGKMIPDQEMAKKLEYALKIKLLVPISKIPVEDKFTKHPLNLTLGDIVKVQDDKK